MMPGGYQHMQQQRWMSSGADAGDVIGIDLGTTNSCVAIMVRVTHLVFRSFVAGSMSNNDTAKKY
jgi:actin-like ATPase involved in cell morphogenesis